MANLILSGSTSGSVTLSSPAVSGTTTLTLPTTSATIATDVNGSLYPLTSSTAQATTSGTSKDFTSIPSWVKRITVMFSGVSTNGTSVVIAQLGSGSVTTSGYSSFAAWAASTNIAASSSLTSGFHLQSGLAATTRFGIMTITNITNNTWVSSHSYGDVGGTVAGMGGGSVALSGTLDRVRITTANGTDAFDAGSINILYE
jgi:hypothetical protein